MNNNARMVPKGRADEEPDAMRRKLRPSTDENATPGTSADVYEIRYFVYTKIFSPSKHSDANSIHPVVCTSGHLDNLRQLWKLNFLHAN